MARTATRGRPAARPQSQTLPPEQPRVLDPAVDEMRPVIVHFERASGRRISPASLWRMIVRGVSDGNGGRIKLEAVFVAGRWVTSAAAVADFIKRSTEVRLQRSTVRDASDAELVEVGL